MLSMTRRKWDVTGLRESRKKRGDDDDCDRSDMRKSEICMFVRWEIVMGDCHGRLVLGIVGWRS
ncbi:predicted protein [Plenodomus lingam JN3]|uniref:Predicted protein n=1 Tax=Leptosphaeria maculans (strain JN3 / isolate v23.1.3 / race Av1-4-5-6-7-8) TaxID=985895 RepID=E4ZPR4_LEPMJ|nr:predicted protein [Plenodomus lingam JN3]CBX93449.1 predicted protein [Plenodomus lingam JN3]